jgi:hypothetical protein
MTSRAIWSSSRTIGALLLLAFTTLSLFIPLAHILSAVVPPASTVPTRPWFVLGIGVCMVILCVIALRERSLIWQLPLQSFALATLVVGMRFLLEAIFLNPQWLLSRGSALCICYVVVGVLAATLMRYLQNRDPRLRNAA